jgi:DNA-binding beta-propeller fold protein YncE
MSRFVRSVAPLAGRSLPLLLALGLPATQAAGARGHRPAQAAPVVFSAPAGDRPAGPLSPADAFGRVLPSGRILHPAGTSVVVGMNALGFALSPDGRYAIVSNCDEREGKTHSLLDPQVTGGYSLAVVDTATMTVVSHYANSALTLFAGIVALPDPAAPGQTLVLAAGGPSNVVYAFDLDPAGELRPDAHATIEIPGASDPAFANAGHSFPGTLVLSQDGARAFVVDNLGNDVAQIDTATRTLAGPSVPVGFFPFGAALSPAGLLVANEGLTAYGVLPAPVAAPPFANVRPDLDRASSLTFLPLALDASLAGHGASVALDRTPDGVHAVGGAHPVAVVALRSRPFAFVALGNVDRVATLQFESAPGNAPDAWRAVGGTELRLFDRGPFGTQPAALALSDDETRLYVALSGINAVAVLDTTDPVHPHRAGLIPTGWYPSALALSKDGRYLYVANAKGLAEDRGFVGDQAVYIDASGRTEMVAADSNAIWSTLERIDLRDVDLRRTTPNALADLRKIGTPHAGGTVPERFASRGSSTIAHVVLILEENKTYDSMLGDLKDAAGAPYGPGDPEYVSFGESVTPNLHALARTFGLAGNLFADAEESDAGHQFVAAGIASDFTEKTLLVKKGRRPLVNKNEDPEDYPRAGYIFNSLADRGKSYRDYGDFVRVSGYDEGGAADPKTDDPQFVSEDDQSAPTQGLGGLFSLDVPAPAVLGGHVDLNYPGWNLRIRDVRRAQEFLRDFDPLVRADAMPAFTYIWLPADHGGAGPDIPPLPEEVADGDRALGTIVDYLTHVPQWKNTAIVIMPDDAQSTRDHVDEHRSYAIVVSPYAKRRYVGMHHLSTVSVLKTEEELLGLPALSLGDELATDMSDFFTPRADYAPYVHVDVPVQTGSLEGRRIGALLARTDQSEPDADSDRTARLIECSREADALVAHRARYAPLAYARLQGELFARAEALVR